MTDVTLTMRQAQMIHQALEVDVLLENEEEVRCLELGNPELLDAYRALREAVEG